MKVLHILNELKHSGAEVMLRQAFGRFSRHGIESHVLSTGENVGEYASVLQETGYTIHHIPFRKHPMFFVALYRLLRRERYPIVHLHTETAFIWYVIALNLAGVKTVVKTFHNVFLFTGYLRWKRALQRKISRRLFHTIQHAISDSVVEFEKKRFRNDCILIKNWTDSDCFAPPKENARRRARELYGLAPQDFVVVTNGSCTEVKNHMAVFSAVNQARRLWQGGRIMVLHVGSGPLLPDEKLYTKKNDIEKYCKFVGTLSDVRRCLYAADVFVMTSLWEGLGNAALEAMSTGIPVILYNVYGLRDLLREGDGGLLIDPTEESLVEALVLLANNPDLRRQKGKRARETVLKSFSLEDSVDRLVGLYTDHRHNPGIAANAAASG
jgi:glycosyltransferase involved in cell wall biosynthesis